MNARAKSLIKQLVGLVAWLSLCFITAAVGVAASVNAGTFYAQLIRPDWAPPASVFGPVWTLLYAMMAVAAWLVWREDGTRGSRIAIVLFLFQLTLNALWSWFFFGWQRGALAFIDIILLWIAILSTLIAFWRVRAMAGVLLLPYLAWVSFAAVLNYRIWQLNPQILGG